MVRPELECIFLWQTGIDFLPDLHLCRGKKFAFYRFHNSSLCRGSNQQVIHRVLKGALWRSFFFLFYFYSELACLYHTLLAACEAFSWDCHGKNRYVVSRQITLMERRGGRQKEEPPPRLFSGHMEASEPERSGDLESPW